MKNENYLMIVLSGTLVVLALLLGACTTSASAAPTAELPQTQTDSAQNAEVSPVLAAPAEDFTTVADDDGATDLNPNSAQANLSLSGELTEEEINGLIFMREEEKLAHDVYIALYQTWGLSIFQNIANSEQTHTDTVKVLLDAYGIADPSANTAPGEFVNPELQALYTQLVAQGSQSLTDALKVGAAIEEIDILESGRAHRPDRKRRHHHRLRKPDERLPQPPALIRLHAEPADWRNLRAAVPQHRCLRQHCRQRHRIRRQQQRPQQPRQRQTPVKNNSISSS